jgi:hypothetical protein
MSDLDRPYTVRDLMALHGLSHHTITKLYENEPGILVYQSQPKQRGQRPYRIIRVPRHVYERVKHRMEVR